jgi:hypothetical protein
MTSALRAKSASKERAPNDDERAAPPFATAPRDEEQGAERAEDRAVRSGYELCDAAIRRGQEAARRFAPNIAEMTSGLRDVPGAKEAYGLAEGAMRVWVDVANAWIRAVLPLAPAGMPDPFHVLDALREASGAGPGAGASRARPVGFVVEIASARPARVAFDLSREHEVSKLAVQPLQPVDPDRKKLPIAGVELRPGADGRTVEIHLAISDAQPAGRYLGAVYDKATGAFVGGLTVDVLG